jgi:hypothetical protein
MLGVAGTGGRRATPSGRGASLAVLGIVVRALLFFCGLPYFIVKAVMLIADDEPVEPPTAVGYLFALIACVALGTAPSNTSTGTAAFRW